jgi:NADH-quinone oxidoreductase subunit N
MQPEKIPAFFTTGLILLLIGLLFKASLFPFHFWAPDVYQGAPTPVTAFMSTVVKTAVIAAAFRLISFTFSSFFPVMEPVLLWVIVLTLIVSNLSASVQSDAKRLMAYSSISHSAFLFLVLYANIKNNISINTLVFYTLVYSIANMGFFSILNFISGYENTGISVFNGLYHKNKYVAFAALLCLLSMAGIPVTAGFFAKYYVLTLLGESQKWGILLLAVVSSLVGVYYYLKIVKAIYFAKPSYDEEFELPENFKTALFMASFLILLFGIAPSFISEMFRIN